MYKDYYSILGISETASLHEIKQAYRKQAKAWHPDVCRHPDARDRFIEINEAYEYLTSNTVIRPHKTSQTNNEYRQRKYNEWQQREREQARKRAEAYAEMNFNSFTKTDIFQSTLEFYLVKTAGCLLTGVFMVCLIVLASMISMYLTIFLLILFIPLSALLMTFSESIIKYASIKKFFKGE